MKKPVVLPRKMSALIRIALKDLEKVERSRIYEVAMGDWHHPLGDGKCAVCFAGAVMAKTCRFKKNDYVYPRRSSMGENLDQFFALDSLRQGEIRLAASELRLSSNVALPEDRRITPYSESPAQFRADMLELAHDLAARGL